MNIPQHWRLNAYRYQLRGTQHEDGSVSFAIRPTVTQRVRQHYLFKEHTTTDEHKIKVEQIA
jgi:hypothetical protein